MQCNVAVKVKDMGGRGGLCGKEALPKKSQGPEERVLVKGFCVGLLLATLAFLNTGSRAPGNKKLRDAVVKAW